MKPLRARFVHPAHDDLILEFDYRYEIEDKFEELLLVGFDNYEVLCPMCGEDMEYLNSKRYYRCTSCHTDVAEDGTILT